MSLLSSDEVNDRLKSFSNWVYENNSIIKEFSSDDFSSVLGFAIKVGIESEKLDHHPDILLHSWNKCKIMISTHSAGGVTDKDFVLAGLIDNLKD